MVTIKDIAKKAKAGISTVSNSLNDRYGENIRITDERRRYIKKVAKTMGYVADDMARSIKTGKSKVIAYVQESISNNFFNGLAHTASEQDYNIDAIAVDPQTDYLNDLVSTIQKRRIAGVVISYNLTSAAILIERLKALEIPYILTCHLEKMPVDVCYSNADNRHGIELALDYFYALGHRRFLYLSIADHEQLANYRQNYFDEYLDSKKDISVCKSSLIGKSRFPFDRFTEIMRDHDSRPTALFCVNPSSAIIGIAELNKMGVRVPQDVSIVAYGDSGIEKLINPAITCIDEKDYTGGQLAANRLIKMIKNNRQSTKTTLYNTELIIRESTVAFKS